MKEKNINPKRARRSHRCRGQKRSPSKGTTTNSAGAARPTAPSTKQLTTQENMRRITQIRKLAKVIGDAAKTKASPGQKQMTYHHTRQAVIAGEAPDVISALLSQDFEITGISLLKESKIRKGTFPVSFKLEIPLSLEEKLKRRDEQRKQRQAAAKGCSGRTPNKPEKGPVK